MVRFFIIFILIAAASYFTIKNLTIPKTIGLINGRLYSCPKSPNCVSSTSQDTEHYIKPLPLADNSLDLIELYLVEHYNTRIVKKTPIYLHAVVTTKYMRFKDDLEFLIDPKDGVIQLRSASRVGYSDMQVNRGRIESLREFLAQTTSR